MCPNGSRFFFHGTFPSHDPMVQTGDVDEKQMYGETASRVPPESESVASNAKQLKLALNEARGPPHERVSSPRHLSLPARPSARHADKPATSDLGPPGRRFFDAGNRWLLASIGHGYVEVGAAACCGCFPAAHQLS